MYNKLSEVCKKCDWCTSLAQCIRDVVVTVLIFYTYTLTIIFLVQSPIKRALNSKLIFQDARNC